MYVKTIFWSIDPSLEKYSKDLRGLKFLNTTNLTFLGARNLIILKQNDEIWYMEMFNNAEKSEYYDSFGVCNNIFQSKIDIRQLSPVATI